MHTVTSTVTIFSSRVTVVLEWVTAQNSPTGAGAAVEARLRMGRKGDAGEIDSVIDYGKPRSKIRIQNGRRLLGGNNIGAPATTRRSSWSQSPFSRQCVDVTANWAAEPLLDLRSHRKTEHFPEGIEGNEFCLLRSILREVAG